MERYEVRRVKEYLGMHKRYLTSFTFEVSIDEEGLLQVMVYDKGCGEFLDAEEGRSFEDVKDLLDKFIY